MPHSITPAQQLAELTSRVTPILNVDAVVFRRKDPDDTTSDPEFLVGHRNPDKYPDVVIDERLFPWGRMHYDETPQEAAHRILEKELPGVQAHFKKIIAAQSDRGYDHRAYGVTIYYLFEYISGEPEQNQDFDAFKRMDEETMRNHENILALDVQLLPEIHTTIRTMNSTQDEILVEVDADNNEIGKIEKRVAHNTTERYHRAAHIMIFNTHGQVVLQKRSKNKERGAGKRDMPGGHQAYGHTMEQTARQELIEEMWVETTLTLQRIGLKQTSTQSERYYLFSGISDGPFGFDKNEVEAVACFDCEKLLAGEYDGEYDILPHVYEYTQELRGVREILTLT